MPNIPFKIEENGWKFSNSSFPNFLYKLPIFPYLRLGKAHRGLCGGMVFSALDYFYAQKAIPKIEILEVNDQNSYFKFIVKRLFHSFQPKAVLWYYILQLPCISDTFRQKHSSKQLQKALLNLSNNKPFPITIILVKSYNPDKLGQQHQVLLTQILKQNDLEIHIQVYDPNYPQKASTLYITMQKNIPIHMSMHGDKIYALQSMKYKAQKV